MGKELPEEQVSRTQAALDELSSGEMQVEPAPDGAFDVKGYTVELSEGTCTCDDFQYRSGYCKHIFGARLASMWGIIDVEKIRDYE